ncbi:hypothetical protein N480_21250 [Pseudoalteromonas luteoviolacea S2607]|nr:hypothetical protein N480_21250 [Pseudoalteromonas luteoviolacea S2607]
MALIAGLLTALTSKYSVWFIPSVFKLEFWSRYSGILILFFEYKTTGV